jgi:hypothetical protein
MNSSTTILAISLALSLGATACGANSQYMHEAKSARPAPPPAGASTVVFLRPSVFAAGIKTTILDERGSFLGESLAESQFAVTLPAGKHLFISWAENTGALQADLAPGKTYYVEVSPTMGALSARVHLFALTPHSENWAKLEEWLRDSKPYDSDQPAGQAYLATRQDDVRERVRRANEAISKYDRDDLAKRTLNADDGR